MRSKRQANFELLRIVAMLMIIVLHYLNKSNLTLSYGEEHTAVRYIANFMMSFCIAAVNCYVLLSGYFLVESAWKPGRVVSLVAQILFYSLLIPVLLLGAGVVSAGDLSAYDWLGFVLPVETEHYWFATAYLMMYVLAPVLAAGVKAVGKRTLQIVIVMLLFYFSVWKSIVPVSFATDKYGYEYGWFVCLFLIAAYIRLYGCPFLEKKRNAVLFYAGMSLGIFLLTAVSGIVAKVLHPFSYYMDMPTTYNHMLCLLGSIGLFMIFKDMKPWEGKTAEIIRRLAPYTFGVYLLHEHILVRYQWMKWLHVESVQESFLFIPHMFGSVLLVYAAGTVVDYVRAWIFRGVSNRAVQIKVKMLNKADGSE